jgi:signal transduction histidine kinase/HAMP domain-containing protein
MAGCEAGDPVPDAPPEAGVIEVMNVRGSIRFRLSVLLLLSTLNTIALGAAAIVLLGDLDRSPPAALQARSRKMSTTVDQLYVDALTTHDGEGAFDPAAAAAATAAIQAEALAIEAEFGTPTAAVRSELLQFEKALVQLTAAEAATAGTPLAPQNGTRDQLLERLRTAQARLSGSILLLGAYTRPPWVDALLPLVPLMMGWVLLIATVTLAVASSLRAALSRPLRDLALAAEGVALGNLERTLPDPVGADEIQALTDAVRRMRDRLVDDLRNEEARSAREGAILDNMSDGVVLLSDGGELITINPPAASLLARLSGTQSKRWVGRNLREAVPEVDLAALGATELSHFSLERTTGSTTLVVDLSIQPVPGVGPHVQRSFVAVLRDTSSAHELEGMKRDFLSVVTHELKTPLTAIEGYARLMLKGKGGELPERQRGFAETIVEQSQVLRTMIQNLLDATRLEGGSLPIDPQPMQVASLVDEAAITWRGTTENRGMKFHADAVGAKGATIMGDRFRLNQVIGNLISNAIKFTPAGGAISLTASRAAATETSTATVIVAVTDTGRGIPRESLELVFDKFYQVERADTRKAGGAGLGLYICRQLIESHGGTIHASSDGATGTRFELRIPEISQESR